MNHWLGAAFIFFLSWIFSRENSFVMGFRVHPPRMLIFHRRASSCHTICPSSRPKWKELELSAGGGNEDDEETEPGKPAKKNNNAALFLLDKASEYLVLLAGVGVAASLTINLLGYGFVEEQGGGVRFDSIQQLRTERQMERSLRIENDDDSRNPPGNNNNNPAILQFFRKSPFLSVFALAIVWQVLEESRDDRKDK